jgi:REP element-mobilizing transposase RayT
MPRQLRLEYPGAIYHIMSRGNRREAIFKDERDREQFLTTLAEVCAKTGWEVHAWCLMSNHFHLVIETPQPNLVIGMKWLLGTYTMRFNRRHKLTGHLFSGRYKSLIVDGSGNGYLLTVCDYVHLNPVRAKLLKAEQPLTEYQWSSYPEYLKTPGQRVNWLRVDRLLGEAGIPKDSRAGRRQFELRMEQRRQPTDAKEWAKVRRGWYLGDEEFREELLAHAQEKMGPSHYGRERQEAAEVKARRIVKEELRRLGWSDRELERRRKGDAEKIRIARRIRKDTTMSLKWIAASLAMGTWTYVANCLCQS